MNDATAHKLALFDACMRFVNEKESTILSSIKSHQHALQSETKSSVGDKHETGRAMLQLEMEKLSQQLHVVYQMKQVMAKIDHNQQEKMARLGSIVSTTKGHYYLAISAGELLVETRRYFAVSTDSPIGKLLLGSLPGDQIYLRDTIEIIDVA